MAFVRSLDDLILLVLYEQKALLRLLVVARGSAGDPVVPVEVIIGREIPSAFVDSRPCTRNAKKQILISTAPLSPVAPRGGRADGLQGPSP